MDHQFISRSSSAEDKGAGSLASYLIPEEDETQQQELQQPPRSDSLTDESLTEFATKDSYGSAGAYLNQSLSMFGYPGPIDFETMAVGDKVNTVNTIYNLLRERQSAAEIRDESNTRLHTLNDENKRLYEKNGSLQNEMKDMEKAMYELDLRKRNLEGEYRKMEAKLKAEILNLQKKNTMLQNRDNQYKHELRKREKDFNGLQERLQKLLSDKSRESKAGMDILNALKGGSRGAKFKGAKPEEELFRQTVNAYEERMNELIVENKQLRASLASLSKELQDALNQHGVMHVRETEQGPEHQFTEPLSPSTKEALEDFNPAQLNMPFDMVKANVEGGLRARITLLKEKIATLHIHEEDASETVEKLKSKIEQQRQIIAEQDQLIRKSIEEEPPEMSQQDLIEQSRRWSMMEELESQQSLLQKQRDASTRSAMELDQQRRDLERARLDFEREKRDWLQQQAQLSPPPKAYTASPASSMGTPDLSSPAPLSASSGSSSASTVSGSGINPAAVPSSKKLSFDSPQHRPLSLPSRPFLASAHNPPAAPAIGRPASGSLSSSAAPAPGTSSAVGTISASSSSSSLARKSTRTTSADIPSSSRADIDPRLVSPMRKMEIENDGDLVTTIPPSPSDAQPRNSRR